ncbi:CHAD domain-containing protein [Vogesella oryzae]|uniref:CHAD domain-containing protein n=1 Tax=Vogesella oryzae TaxID=1735285 RepID=UPI00158252E7|nr:CHAD domain-containing protein [Vogesella oryzae]
MKRKSPRRLLRRRLQLLLQQIRSALPQLADTAVPEALHALRIALRQLRSLLRVLQALPQGELLPALSLQLAAFTRASNDWRDREVRLQQLQLLAQQADSQRFAAWRRHEAFAIGAGKLQLARQQGELEPLLLAIEQACLPPLRNKSVVLRRQVRRALRDSRQRYREARRRWQQQPDNDRRVHKVRLLAKRLRYQVEVCQGLLAKRWQRRAERARADQQQLGELRDRQLLLQSLRRDAVPLPAALRRQLGLAD